MTNINEVCRLLHEHYESSSWYYTAGADVENEVLYLYGKRRPPRCTRIPAEFHDYPVKFRVIGNYAKSQDEH